MKVNKTIAKMLFDLLYGLEKNKVVVLNNPTIQNVPVPYITHNGLLYVMEGNDVNPALYDTIFVKDYIFELLRWVAKQPALKQLEMTLELSRFINTHDISKTLHSSRGLLGYFKYVGGARHPDSNNLVAKYFPYFSLEPGDKPIKNSFKWWLKETIKRREVSSKPVEKLEDKDDVDQLDIQIKLFGLVDAKGFELFNLDNLANNFDIDRNCEECCFALVASVALFETLPGHVTTLQDIHASIKFFKSLFNSYMTTDKELYESRSGLRNATDTYKNIEDKLDQGMKEFIDGNLENFIVVFSRYKESRKAYYDSLKA